MSENQAVLLTVGAIIFVVCAFLFMLRNLANARALDPEIVLMRCRFELRLMRRELCQWPATTEVHLMVAGIDNMQATIDELLKRFSGNESKKEITQ